jgi:hypothetical protein
MSPHHRQVGTSNLLLHDDVRATKAAGSIGSTAKQGCSPWRNEIDLTEATRSQAAEDFEYENLI